MNRYNSVVSKFGVSEGSRILELLKDAYRAQYQWHLQMDDDEKKKDEKGREYYEKIEGLIEKQIGDSSSAFLKELHQLCEESDYLSRYSLSHSFLQLYRSPSYEKYINNKKNYIILDTPVVTNYLCYLSKIDDKIDLDWDNLDYQNV